MLQCDCIIINSFCLDICLTRFEHRLNLLNTGMDHLMTLLDQESVKTLVLLAGYWYRPVGIYQRLKLPIFKTIGQIIIR